jgi:hypothetical protein
LLVDLTTRPRFEKWAKGRDIDLLRGFRIAVHPPMAVHAVRRLADPPLQVNARIIANRLMHVGKPPNAMENGAVDAISGPVVITVPLTKWLQ